MTSLPRIYKTEKEYIEGIVYIEFSCGCIFLDSEDKKRKQRVTLEIKNGKRSNRTFCPNHKKTSLVKHRFKICPNCQKLITVTNNTKGGPCASCVTKLKKEETKKNNQKNNQIKKQKDCLQYGKEYQLKTKENIISKPMCKNRDYCLSFIVRPTTLIQCDGCPQLDDNIFGD